MFLIRPFPSASQCVSHLPPAKQPVSPEPEVRSTKRLSSDQFVLLACDGVWDVMSSADAIAFVSNLLERTPEVQGTSEAEQRSELYATQQMDAARPGPEPPGLLSRQSSAHIAATNAAHLIQQAEKDDDMERLSLGVICEMLIDECVSRGSTDNISVVLVILDHSLRAKQGFLSAAEAAHRVAAAAAAAGLSHPKELPAALLARATRQHQLSAADKHPQASTPITPNPKHISSESARIYTSDTMMNEAEAVEGLRARLTQALVGPFSLFSSHHHQPADMHRAHEQSPESACQLSVQPQHHHRVAKERQQQDAVLIHPADEQSLRLKSEARAQHGVDLHMDRPSHVQDSRRYDTLSCPYTADNY